METDPVFVVAVLAANVVISEWLVRHTFLKHFGTALLVIVVTAVTANLGLIPSRSLSNLAIKAEGGRNVALKSYLYMMLHT